MGTATEPKERVSVLAKFEGGRALPVLMRRQGRRYWIQKLNLHHTQRQGADTIHYYAVTTEAGDCVLSYSQQHLVWTLDEVRFDGS
jgi:hypothetical protein